MKTKKCPKCQIEKPVTEEFWYLNKKGVSKGKPAAYCIPCHKEYMNQDKFKKFRRDYVNNLRKKNPEYWKELRDKYVSNNREAYNNRIYRWTRENKDVNLAIQKKYQQTIPPSVYSIKYEDTVIYIGSSNEPVRRLNVHFSTIKTCNNIGKVNKLFSFYGYDKSKFSYEIVEQVDVDKLIERERYWEEHFDAKVNYKKTFGKLESVKKLLERLGYL